MSTIKSTWGLLHWDADTEIPISNLCVVTTNRGTLQLSLELRSFIPNNIGSIVDEIVIELEEPFIEQLKMQLKGA